MIFVTSILIILFDQLSKYLISSYLAVNQSQPLIPNIFHLTLVHNTGIAFGLFRGGGRVVFLFTIIGLIIVVYSLRKDMREYYQQHHVKHIPFIDRLALGLIIGGALANMIDRVRCGYVIDFLDFRVWPVFNIADSCITIGVCLFAWRLVCLGQERKQRAS